MSNQLKAGIARLTLACFLFSQLARPVTVDSVGNVINTADATTIFGPMVAYGHNPWHYADERAHTASDLQTSNNTYPTSTAGAGTWTIPGAGTIAYPFFGKGFFPGPTCTTLSSGISATATSISVADASCLSLSSFPTYILVGASSFSDPEMICIASTTGTTGPQTLTVCYDGRGIAGAPGSTTENPVAAQSWSSGAIVGEFRVQGTSTLFGTDTNSPICPAGLPGPPGAVVYSSGTVRLTASSTAIAGTSTNWTNGNGVFATYNIRVAATHASGTPFVFIAQISVLGGVASITASRAAPADVDTTTDFSYKIVSTRYPSLEFHDATGGLHRSLQGIVRCESETAMFGMPTHDFPLLYSNNDQSGGLRYSYKDALGAQSAFGPNFYGTGLAQHAQALQSGYAPAAALYPKIDDNWIRDPELSGGMGGLASPLLLGGGVVGALARLQLDPGSTLLNWTDYTPFAELGVSGTYGSTSGCNDGDSRDTGWAQAWTALAALFDPDATRHAHWISGLRAWLTRDQGCMRTAADGYTNEEVNSLANSFNTGLIGPTVTLDGTSIVTGSGFSAAGLCSGDGYGTITVTHGLATATIASSALGTPSHTTGDGTGTGTDLRIWITDTATPPHTEAFEYSTSGSAATLAGTWGGASGTFDYLTESASGGAQVVQTSIGNTDSRSVDTAASNHQWKQNYGCVTIDDTHIRLDRPSVVSGSNYHIYNRNAGAGFLQIYYMLGIKIQAMKWASLVDDPTVANGYKAIIPLVAQNLVTYGWDPNTKGTNYGGVAGLCVPGGTPNAVAPFWTVRGSSGGQAVCGWSGLLPQGTNGEYTSRVASAEALHGYIEFFLANQSLANMQFVDVVYGAIYGNPAATDAGYYSDIHYVNENNELFDGSFGIGGIKWDGFFFGAGMAHQWPAIRAAYLQSRVKHGLVGNVSLRGTGAIR